MELNIIHHTASIRRFASKNFMYFFGAISVLYMILNSPFSTAAAFLGIAFLMIFLMSCSDKTTHEITLQQLLGLLLVVFAYRLYLGDQLLSIIVRLVFGGSFFWMQQLFTRKSIKTENYCQAGPEVAYIPYFAAAISAPVILGVINYFNIFNNLSAYLTLFDKIMNLYFSSILGFVPIAVFLFMCGFMLFRSRKDNSIQVTMGTGDVFFLSIMFLMMSPSYFLAAYIFSLLLVLFDSVLMQKGVNV